MSQRPQANDISAICKNARELFFTHPLKVRQLILLCNISVNVSFTESKYVAIEIINPPSPFPFIHDPFKIQNLKKNLL